MWLQSNVWYDTIRHVAVVIPWQRMLLSNKVNVEVKNYFLRRHFTAVNIRLRSGRRMANATTSYSSVQRRTFVTAVSVSVCWRHAMTNHINCTYDRRSAVSCSRLEVFVNGNGFLIPVPSHSNLAIPIPMIVEFHSHSLPVPISHSRSLPKNSRIL